MEVRRVERMFAEVNLNGPGFYRVLGPTPGGHPADGMTALISHGDGAYSTIINPQSFENGGPEWVMRYGDPVSIRYTVAGLLETFDYLLSDAINMKEATERLRTMRAVRRELASQKEGDGG